MPIQRRLHHVAVAVRDLDAAVLFYGDGLGLPVQQRSVLWDQEVEVARLRLGNCRLDLVQPLSPSGSVARFIERRGEVMHHLCLESDDIEAEMAELRDSGIGLVDQSPRAGLSGRVCSIYPRFHAGVLVELAEDSTEASGEWWLESLPKLVALQMFTYNVKAAAEAWRVSFGLESSVPNEWMGGAWVGDVRFRFAEMMKGQKTFEGLFSLDLAVTNLDWLVSRLGDSGAGVSERTGDGSGHDFALVFDGASHNFLITLTEADRAQT
jgi:methylmalonyl-CoA epimerase